MRSEETQAPSQGSGFVVGVLSEPTAPATKVTKSTRSSPPQLRRELGLGGAVMMGLGSIVGTGVFVSLGVAAGVTGQGLLLAVCFAGILALCNGLSSAQLAAAHPVSGGTYEYGYQFLGAWWGYLAGWLFLCAKSASAATAALGVAGYLTSTLAWTETASRGLVLGVIVLVALVVLGGVRRSHWMNVAIVLGALGSLVVFVGLGLFSAPKHQGSLWPDFAMLSTGTGLRRLLYGTALVFVAYTGYGRIATLGEEVKEPRKTIPKAMIVTLFAVASLYFVVAFVALYQVGPIPFAALTLQSAAPLQAIAQQMAGGWAAQVLAWGAIFAMLGVLLNLLLGLSRVLLAMGRRGDMPGVVARIDRSGKTPWVAVLVIAVVIGGIAGWGTLQMAWSFSAFSVLLYYAITNLAALQLPPEHRRFPRWVSVLGLLGCIGLCPWIEGRVWLIGGGILIVGVLWRLLWSRVGTTPG